MIQRAHIGGGWVRGEEGGGVGMEKIAVSDGMLIQEGNVTAGPLPPDEGPRRRGWAGFCPPSCPTLPPLAPGGGRGGGRGMVRELGRIISVGVAGQVVVYLFIYWFFFFFLRLCSESRVFL